MCYNSYIQFKEIHTCGSRPLEKPCLTSVAALIKTGFFISMQLSYNLLFSIFFHKAKFNAIKKAFVSFFLCN